MGYFHKMLDDIQALATKNNMTGVILTRDTIAKQSGVKNPGTLSHDVRYHSKKLIRVKRGIYTLGNITPNVLANKLVEPSYISLEKVLSAEGMIPEFITSFTSITTKNGTEIENQFGRFEYRHINDRLFFGFHLDEDGAYIADREKAILDYIYLNGDLFTIDQKIMNAVEKRNHTLLGKTLFLQFRSVRLQGLDTMNWEKFFTYANQFGKKKLIFVARALQEYCSSKEYEFHI